MAIIPKDWRNFFAGGTPVDAAALIDLEQRMGAYADSIAQAGVELGRAEITANATNATNTFADVAGLSVTITTPAVPLEVVLFTPYGTNSVAGGSYNQQILVDGVVIGVSTVNAAVAGSGASAISIGIITPTAGSHTFKAQMRAGAASQTATMWAFPTSPSFISVRRR